MSNVAASANENAPARASVAEIARPAGEPSGDEVGLNSRFLPASPAA